MVTLSLGQLPHARSTPSELWVRKYQTRKKGFGHVPGDGIAYLIPATKKSRNHPVMSDDDVDVGDEVDVVLARSGAEMPYDS